MYRALRVADVTAVNSKWKTLLSEVDVFLSDLRSSLNFDRDFHVTIKLLSASRNIQQSA